MRMISRQDPSGLDLFFSQALILAGGSLSVVGFTLLLFYLWISFAGWT